VATGFVWNDWNGNKTVDGEEPKLLNITVRVTGGQEETLTVETEASFALDDAESREVRDSL
jgi:hypothetical protein